MFSKKQQRLETIIGPESNIKGELSSKGTLRIDGTLDGNITADWVILGETGVVNGDVAATGMIIGGRIKGNIRASEMVEIRTKGEVVGEIYTAKLTIQEGAVFDGHSIMQRSREIEYKTIETRSGE